MSEGIGDKYQKETKYHLERMEGGGLDWENKPEIYKEYPNSEKIALPRIDSFDLPKKKSLDEAFRTRRSIRQFSGETMVLGYLAYLLWASTGIQRMEMGYEYRTAPSAGALYPIETYLVINDVAGVDNGVYHYSVRTHQLEEIKLGNFQFDIAKAALGQRVCLEANVNFVWTAIFERSKWKYKQRAYRYIYLDAGHIAENLALAAVSLDFGSCQIGAIFDDEVNKIIGVDGEAESAIYLSAVGSV
jgi:SagB-type dehydrogenase family enzyme